MRKIIVIFIIGLFLFITNQPLMAGGGLKKLQGIAKSMALQQEALKEEAENYSKAKEFINSPDIKKDLSSDFILKRCGQPVVTVENGRRWVYKPPSSTFFEGEKIYFIFDENNKLVSWKKLRQQ